MGKKTANTQQPVKDAVLPNGEEGKSSNASFLSLGITTLKELHGGKDEWWAFKFQVLNWGCETEEVSGYPLETFANSRSVCLVADGLGGSNYSPLQIYFVESEELPV